MIGLQGLWWRIWRSMRNTTWHAAGSEPLRAGSAVGVLVTVGLMIYLLVRTMLRFLQADDRYRNLMDPLTDSLLGLFFFTIFFLVGFSTMLVIWSALFRTESARFLAQLPVGNRALYWSAVTEGGLIASWATLILAGPVLVGLALHAQVFEPARFLVAAVVALLAFLAVCMAVGGCGAVILARLIPLVRRISKPVVVLLLVLGALLALRFTGQLEQQRDHYDYLSRVLDRIGFVHNPLLPPQWSQAAVRAAMDSNWTSWAYHVGLLVSTAGAVALLGEWIAHRRFRIDLDALAGRRRRGPTAAVRHLAPLPGLPADLGLLVAKDLRMFRRDPAQLLQFALFFGMLGFYILLLPRIGRAFLSQEWWTTAVSVLNLLAVSMALATFTGRFVYPLPSLEGKRLWVLVLAPWPLGRVITAKFCFAILVGVPVSTLLVGMSGAMLDMDPAVIAFQCLVTVCLGFGLSAAALGIGASLADLREDNPAKLVAGYGGTINLLASLVFCGLLIPASCLPLIVADPLWGWAGGISIVLCLTLVWTVGFLLRAHRAFARLVERA